jgi:uncharacterized protein YdhG (YjbR/CyaY superfamily)
VRTYLAALPAETRKYVQKLRAAIRAAAPGAVESLGYGMPAFSLKGKPFVWYDAWKRHSSLYPLSEATTRAVTPELEGYETSGKGTIPFRLHEPPPTSLEVIGNGGGVGSGGAGGWGLIGVSLSFDSFHSSHRMAFIS